jgi:hypothetical protein
MEYNAPVAEGREPVGTNMGPTKGIDESITGASKGVNGPVTDADDLYGATSGAAGPMEGATTEERDFTGGMGSAGIESQGISGAEAGAPGIGTAMPETQGYGQSTVGTMTDGVPETSGMKQSAGYESDDWDKSSTGDRGIGNDTNGPMGESRDLDESTKGTEMNGRGQTRNLEESVSQFTNDTDGSITTRTVRETVVTRNPSGLVDGAQDTREKLQTQPHMLGGFGLQTIGVPY